VCRWRVHQHSVLAWFMEVWSSRFSRYLTCSSLLNFIDHLLGRSISVISFILYLSIWLSCFHGIINE
jgi:hypothetical protein